MIRNIISQMLKLISPSTKVNLASEYLLAATKGLSPKDSLRFLFEVDNRLYGLEGKAAVDYGDGIHPKHRLTEYHEFFIKHLESNDKVLDIGCGNGWVDHVLIQRVPGLRVVGIDNNKDNILHAKKNFTHPNLTFKWGDIKYIDSLYEEFVLDSKFDLAILSNILEHIENRKSLLCRIAIITSKILIRVPCYDRDWRVPLKDELGVDSRLDSTHHIEYTQETFREEIEAAGLTVTHIEIKWGEIWGVVSGKKGSLND